MKSNIEKLLEQMRATSSNSPLVSILEQAESARTGKKAVRPHKKYKQDKRTARKRFYAWRRERADELREYNAGLRQMFFHLRREVKYRKKREETGCWDWELSMGEWILLWLGCPAIEVGHNVYKQAWQMRGRDSSKDVQLKRIDPTKPWAINNLSVMYKGKKINHD